MSPTPLRIIAGLLLLAPTAVGAALTLGTHSTIDGAWSTDTTAAAAPTLTGPDLTDARRAIGQASSQAGFLTAGTDELKNGTDLLADKTGELTSGVEQINDGAKQLADGLVQLQAGTGQMGTGATEIADGVAGAIEQFQGLTVIQTQIIGALDKLDHDLEQSTDPRAPGWRKQLADLRTMAAQVGINGDVIDQLDRLRTGTRDLSNQLAVPGYGFHDGIYEATAGAKKLADATQQLADGTTEATDGVTQLAEGADKVDQMATRTRDDITAASRALPAAQPTPGENTTDGDAQRSLALMLAFFTATLVTLAGSVLWATNTTRLGTTAAGVVGITALGTLALAVTAPTQPVAILALMAALLAGTTIAATTNARALINYFGAKLGRIILYAGLLIQTGIVGSVWTQAATTEPTTAWRLASALMPLHYSVDALVTLGNAGQFQHLAIAIGVLAAWFVVSYLFGRAKSAEE